MASNSHAPLRSAVPKRPLKLLLVTAYFPPDSGSAPTLFHELGTALAARGHEVTVVTSIPSYHPQGDLSKYTGKLRVTEQMGGVRVERVATPAWVKRTMVGRALWQFTSAMAFALLALRQPRHDLALLYSPPLPLGLSAWVLRRFRRTPFIVNVQDLFPQSVIDLGLLKNPVIIKAFRMMERFIYKRAAHVTVHSSSNRDHVVRNGGRADRTTVVPNWVDTVLITPGDRANAFRARNGLGDAFVLSFGGIIGYSQDLDTVIDAAALTSDDTNMLWLIVGDGVEKPRLEAKAQEMGLKNVRFLPMIPREEYAEMLQASDVGLVTLHANVKTPVVPSKITSIMAAGIPVLAAMPGEGDAAALIREAQAGVCVAPQDPQALAEAARQLSSDAELGRKMGRQGREYAETSLSIESAVAQYEQIAFQMDDP
jgi:colanic acid biosynthesis glycosyl transferase WcaI